MAKKAKPESVPTWAISRIKSTPAVTLGHVEAPDAESAIREAIKRFGITDPEQQKRLAARRRFEQGRLGLLAVVTYAFFKDFGLPTSH
jgi:hypothetical protein